MRYIIKENLKTLEVGDAPSFIFPYKLVSYTTKTEVKKITRIYKTLKDKPFSKIKLIKATYVWMTEEGVIDTAIISVETPIVEDKLIERLKKLASKFEWSYENGLLELIFKWPKKKRGKRKKKRRKTKKR